MLKHFIDLLIDDDGATLVEYGLVVLLIATVSIAAVALLGTNTANLYARVIPAF